MHIDRLKRLPTLSQPLDVAAEPIYQQMMARLQYEMLVWLMVVGVPIGVVFGAQLFHTSFVSHTMPAAAFVIHTVRLALMTILVIFFLRRGMVRVAWASLLIVSLGLLLAQIWLLREPSLLGFALFSLAGPAIILPLHISALLVGALVIALFLIVRFSFPIYTDTWVPTALSVTALIFGFAFIGIVVRRFVRQFANTTVKLEREATQRGKLEQQMLDLHQEVEHLASLEHDLRQPLRAVQGYLTTLIDERTVADDVVEPALAAAQRADRLINNMLDLARAEAQQQSSLRRPVDMHRLLRTVEETIPGLARYYTDPPVPVRFTLHPLTTAAIDQEQFERALLNLLDNALVYSPPDGVVDVRAWSTDSHIMIEVHDQGPGIPQDIVQALFADEPLCSQRKPRQGLGLRQVYSTIQAHGGSLSIRSAAHGTSVQMKIPIKQN